MIDEKGNEFKFAVPLLAALLEETGDVENTLVGPLPQKFNVSTPGENVERIDFHHKEHFHHKERGTSMLMAPQTEGYPTHLLTLVPVCGILLV